MRKTFTTRNIAISALATSSSLAIFWLTSWVNTLDLTVAALGALLVYVVLLETNKTCAGLVFGAVSCLSMLLPNKNPAFFFVCFFGWYPLLCALVARFPKWINRVVKFFAAALALGIYLAVYIFFFELPDHFFLLLVFGVPIYFFVFLLYDLALARLVLLYRVKLRPKLFRK